MPTFTLAGGSVGLSLLASVASKAPILSPTSHPSSHISTLPTAGLHTKGPYNLVAVLPTNIAKENLEPRVRGDARQCFLHVTNNLLQFDTETF